MAAGFLTGCNRYQSYSTPAEAYRNQLVFGGGKTFETTGGASLHEVAQEALRQYTHDSVTPIYVADKDSAGALSYGLVYEKEGLAPAHETWNVDTVIEVGTPAVDANKALGWGDLKSEGYVCIATGSKGSFVGVYFRENSAGQNTWQYGVPTLLGPEQWFEALQTIKDYADGEPYELKLIPTSNDRFSWLAARVGNEMFVTPSRMEGVTSIDAEETEVAMGSVYPLGILQKRILLP
ncbi:MAG: hypothetical protein AB2L09_08965 [Coriobacteriia bacterium]